MVRRAVITGIGIIAPNGIGKEKYWAAIRSGVSGIKKIESFDVSSYPSKFAGEVNDFKPEEFMEKKEARLLSRFAQFSLAATRMAFDDAGLEMHNEDPHRMGIAFGNTVGGKDVEERQRLKHQACNDVNPFSAALINSNLAVGVIANEFGIRGPNINFSTGCTSALNAIAYGFDLVREGKVEVLVAGGSETPLVPFVFNAFCASGGLSKRTENPETASRPFDKNRDGYVLSEGCAVIIIESEDHARVRKARIYAEVAGYGITNDAYSLVKMEPTGQEAAHAMQLALMNSKVLPQQVNYINAHGSSSLLADKRETSAIKRVFGENAYTVLISSIKSMIGQSLGATGAFQVATTALAIESGCIPPTINYEEQDPECDLDYTPNHARSRTISAALVNSFGLGGNNVSLVLKEAMGGEKLCISH